MAACGAMDPNGLCGHVVEAGLERIVVELDGGLRVRVQPAADGVVRVLFTQLSRAGGGSGSKSGGGGSGGEDEVVVPRTWTVVGPDEMDAPLEGRPRLNAPPGAPPFMRVSEASPGPAGAEEGGGGGEGRDGAAAVLAADAPGGLRLLLHASPFRLSWLLAVPPGPQRPGPSEGSLPAPVPAAAGAAAAAPAAPATAEEPASASVAIEFAWDRASRPYSFGTHGGARSLRHAMARQPGDRYHGLGDKTGPLDLSGRRLRVAMADALGYDPEGGDPLYKAWPLLVARDGSSGLWYGLLYDNHAEGVFDLGCEHSNYYGPYRYYEARDGDLDYYIIAGPTLRAVMARFSSLTGHMALGPRWSLGYAATAMPLADAPDAQERVEGFLVEAERHNIPLSAFHFGSGYTSIGPRRYTFHWNRAKFPDPRGLAARARGAATRLVANVKPCLLDDHPLFKEAAEEGALVLDASGSRPSMAPFWDGAGAHVDFTSTAGVAWWQRGLRGALFANGIDGVWNDNNEYELWEDDARCACTNGRGRDGGGDLDVTSGEGGWLPLALARPLQGLLMARASHEAQAAAAPQERPYTVTRAGCPGVQRYAQSWSGDNGTCWRHLRWNLRTGMQLGLSGMANIGHDVGGFSGPPPDGELLLRWLQAGALHPRFVTNSWKPCGTVTSPWMHPELVPLARWAVRLRYRLMPYLYSCYIAAALAGEPVVRPTSFDFPDDPRAADEAATGDQLMVGPCLLAAPALEPGAREVQVYLPLGPAAWYDFYTEDTHPPGTTITAAAPLDRIPLFVPAGAVLPLTGEAGDFSALHDEPSRCLRVFPPPPRAAPPRAGGGGGGSQAGAGGAAAVLPAGSAADDDGDDDYDDDMRSSGTWEGFVLFEDDGISPPPTDALARARRAATAAAVSASAGHGATAALPALPGGAALRFRVEASAGRVRLEAEVEGGYGLPYDVMTVAPPAADGRELELIIRRAPRRGGCSEDSGGGGVGCGGEGGGAGSGDGSRGGGEPGAPPLPRLERGAFELHGALWA